MSTTMTNLRRRAVTAIGVLALAATGVACGGDDGGGGGSGPQAQLADEFIAETAGEGLDVDESCIRRVTGGLSDADARALLEDNDDDLSMEGAFAMFELLECIDFDFDFDFDD